MQEGVCLPELVNKMMEKNLENILMKLKFKILKIIIPAGLLLFSGLPVEAQERRFPEGTVLKSASEIGYPPYSVVDDSGEADGFAVELLRATLKEMGLGVEFKIGYWKDVKESLEKGEVDFLPLVGRTREREENFDFTVPYLTMRGVILVRGETTGIVSLNDLKGKKLAVMKGDNAEEFVSRINLDADIIAEATYEEAVKKLSAGKVDAVIIQKLLALQLTDDLGLDNLKIAGEPLEEFPQHFCFAVKEGDAELLSVLNEGLSRVIAKDIYRRLYLKWIRPVEKRGETKLLVGGDSDFPPYEFLDKKGRPAGFNVDIIRAVAEQAGLDIRIILAPWAETKERLAEGKIDIIQGMLYSAEREKIYDFSQSHTVISQGIAYRKGGEKLKSLKKLEGKSILVQKGDIMHEQALKYGYGKNITVVANQEEALKMIDGGRYDCALGSYLTAVYLKKENNLQNIELAKIPISSEEYCFAVKEGDIRLAGLLSAALAEINETGRYREIYDKWFGVYEKNNLASFLRYGLYVIIPLLLVMLFSFIWSVVLKKKVRKKTSQLNHQNIKLSEAELNIAESVREKESLNIFLNNILESSLAVSIIVSDIDGTITYWNKGAQNIFGYSAKEMIGKKQIRLMYHAERDREIIEKAKDRVIKEKKPQTLRIAEKTKSGEKIYIELTISPIFDKDGHLTGFSGMGKDITKSIKYQHIRKKQRKFNKIKTEIWKLAALKSSDEKFFSDEKALIERVLNKIGPVLDVSRVSYIYTAEQDKKVVSVEWVADGVKSTRGEAVPRKLLDYALKTGKHLINEDILKDKIPAFLKPLFNSVVKKFKEEWDIDYLWLYPVYREKKLAAALSFDICFSNKVKPELDKSTELFINDVVHIISHDLEKRKMAKNSESLMNQLQHSQKMESIGTLAGGIAHDFNNILTSIIGDAELLLEEERIKGQDRKDIENIKKSSLRAADLVGQLLVFSRTTPAEKNNINIDAVVKDMLKMLGRLLGEDITIDARLAAEGVSVKADRTNIEQVITNLTVNSLYAMPDGGEIIIETKVENIKETEHTIYGDIFPGKYICLTVEDSGRGMDKKTVENIFEPFFTTKKTEGTGLGLSVVFGIIKDHDAVIKVWTEPGEGTRFSMYFPALEEEINKKPVKEKDHKADTGRGQKILIVEDEQQILKLAARILGKNNYKPVSASDKGKAVNIYKEQKGDFDLVFSDMILPDGTGLELIEELKKIKPPKNMLLTSGYLDKKGQTEEIVKNNIPFINKPYNVKDLLRKIAEIFNKKKDLRDRSR
jgi:PAS domain S-box-containing protein